jgi:hypothetical protein
MKSQQPEETENVFGPDYGMIPIVGTAETPAELVALLHAAHRRDHVTVYCAPPPETCFRPAEARSKLPRPRRPRRRTGFRCPHCSTPATTHE